jgi:hypothetical protein
VSIDPSEREIWVQLQLEPDGAEFTTTRRSKPNPEPGFYVVSISTSAQRF